MKNIECLVLLGAGKKNGAMGKPLSCRIEERLADSVPIWLAYTDAQKQDGVWHLLQEGKHQGEGCCLLKAVDKGGLWGTACAMGCGWRSTCIPTVLSELASTREGSYCLH